MGALEDTTSKFKYGLLFKKKNKKQKMAFEPGNDMINL